MNNNSYEFDNFLGDRMREIRLALELTQEDLAKALSVSRSTYSYYELGVTMPDPRALGRMSEYLDIPIDSFYAEEMPPLAPLRDSKGRPHRPNRTASLDPEKFGDLRPAERTLILFLRANGKVDAKATLDYLEKNVGWPKKLPPRNKK